MNAKVRIWGWFLSVLILAVPAIGQTARGYVWEDGRLKSVGESIQYTEPYEGEEDSPVANENNVWITGDSDGDYSNANNWSLAHVPLITENVIFNRTAVTSVTTGLDQGGVNLNSFTRHPLYTGSLGTSGGPLIINTVADNTGVTGNVVIQGPGACYLEAGAGGSGLIEYLYIDTDEQATEIELDGSIHSLVLLKGRVVGLSGFDGSYVWVSYRNNPSTDAHLTLEGTASIGETALNGGAVVHTGTGAIAVCTMGSGRLTQGLSAGPLSFVRMTGGQIEYNAATGPSYAFVLGGTLNLSRDGRPKTVGHLVVFPGGQFIPNANTTITNNNQGSILPIPPIIP